MPETRSKTALGAMSLTCAGAALAVLGVLGIQVGVLPPRIGFYFFGLGTVVCGALGLVLGGIAILRTRRLHGPRAQRQALVATAIAVGLLAVVFLSTGEGGDAPPINDITTDLERPPSFAPASAVPAYGDDDMLYPDEFVPIVREAYPDLAPIETSLPPADAYARALATARALGWEISWQAPDAGRFDATDTTRIFRFVDDVTVRVEPTAKGSRIDLRSRSRVGKGDIGANAARIRRFVAAFEAGG